MPIESVQRSSRIIPPGGGPEGHIIRPNLALINRLRGRPLTEPRPNAIRTVLIVDDNLDVIEISADLLHEHFAEVSGRQIDLIKLSSLKGKRLSPDSRAVIWVDSIPDLTLVPGFVAANGVDFVFSDFNMPGLNGDEIVRQVRAATMPTQPIMVGITGVNKNIASFYAAGADLAAMKPFPLNDLFI